MVFESISRFWFDKTETFFLTLSELEEYVALLLPILFNLLLLCCSCEVPLFSLSFGVFLLVVSLLSSVCCFCSFKEYPLSLLDRASASIIRSAKGPNCGEGSTYTLKIWNPSPISKNLFIFFSPPSVFFLILGESLPIGCNFSGRLLFSLCLTLSFFFFSYIYEHKMQDKELVTKLLMREYQKAHSRGVPQRSASQTDERFWNQQRVGFIQNAEDFFS